VISREINKIVILKNNVIGILTTLPRPVYGKYSINKSMVTILGIMAKKKVITNLFM